MHPLLQKAFDPEEFKKTGYDLIDKLAQHLTSCQSGNNPVLTLHPPEDEYTYWKDYKIQDPSQFFQDIIDRNIHVHHKNYIGHQVAAPAPLAALSGLLSDLMNDGMGIYEMGAAATAIERVVTEIFARGIGFSENANGVLTSGGTLANLTALLAARAKYRSKYSDSKPYIFVSDQAHYCIERAAMTMGMAPDQVIKINTNNKYQIDIDQLKTEINLHTQNGQQILAVIGCACSTATGSYDNLEAIADICTTKDLWFHIDGAHGGAAVFSDKYKFLCKGMERADSVIIDAHKMMLVPALATAVVFKRPEDSYRALEIEATYLFESKEAEWYNLTKRTYETTKYMMSIKVFLLMRYYGLDLIDVYVSSRYDLAREFADLIRKRDSFQLAHRPMSNIVCFRYLPDLPDIDAFTREVRKYIVSEGKFYIVQTMLKGVQYLRITIMSPYTSLTQLSALLDTIEETAIKIQK